MLFYSLYMNQSKSIYQNLETVDEIKELALKYLDKYQPSKKVCKFIFLER